MIVVPSWSYRDASTALAGPFPFGNHVGITALAYFAVVLPSGSSHVSSASRTSGNRGLDFCFWCVAGVGSDGGVIRSAEDPVLYFFLYKSFPETVNNCSIPGTECGAGELRDFRQSVSSESVFNGFGRCDYAVRLVVDIFVGCSDVRVIT